MRSRLASAIWSNVDTRPDTTAVIQHAASPRRVTYGELGAEALRVQAFLAEVVRPGHTVGILARRSIEHIATVVASLSAGITYFSINPAASLPQVANMVRLAGTDVLVVDNAALLKLGRVEADDFAGVRLLHLNEGPFSAAHEKILERLSERVEVLSLPEGAPGTTEPAAPSGAPGCMLFTSGSTGTPRAVLIGADDLADRAEGEAETFGVEAGDRLLNVLPFSFDVGCNQLLTSLTTGATLVVLNSWLPRDILAAVAEHDVSGVSAVPAIWEILFTHDPTAVRDGLRGLRYLTISGGDLDTAGLEKLRDLTPGVGIFKTYGQTETFRSAVLGPEEFEARPTSVGRPPKGAHFSVVDSERRPVEPGTPGEIVHQGTGTMIGYLRDEEATDAKVIELGGPDGAPLRTVLTGDRGQMDEDGYLFVHGRMDRMLKIRGNRVYPEEVEAELRAHPDVADAVVVMLPGDDGSELVGGVVPTNGAIDPRSVRSYLARRVMAFMLPQRIVECEDFPRTSTGKIDLRGVRGLLKRTLTESE